MFVLLTLGIMLGLAYVFLQEGLLTACCMLVNVLLAGLVAFGFYELLANELDPMLAGTFLAGFEDCLCLVLLFSLVLGLLRLATYSLAYTSLDIPPAVERVGGALFGLVTGYLVAGFLLVVVQTLPFPEGSLPLDHKVNSERVGSHTFPPDRVWLAMMHRAGLGPFSWGDGPTFDPHGNFSLRNARYHRKDDNDQMRKDDGACPTK